MAMFSVSSVTPSTSANSLASGAKAQPSTAPSFAEQLKNAIAQVASTQQQADAATLRMAAGDLPNLHQAAIAMEEAKLTLQLAVQVRNKIVEAYQEISRMQV